MKIKILIVSALLLIIPLSLLFTGCKNEYKNKAMDEKISRLEKEVEKRIIYKIQEQQSYFSKHKTFFKPPDEPATKYVFWAVVDNRESPKIYQMTAWVSATVRSIKYPAVEN